MTEPPPTSPHKRALMPSGKLRRALRAHGHGQSALVQIGKNGVTRGLLKELAQALHDHELVKVKIGSECPQDRFAVADALAAEPGTNVVQILGRTLLVYKRHPHAPRFEGPPRPSSSKGSPKDTSKGRSQGTSVDRRPPREASRRPSRRPPGGKKPRSR
jgi:RNA-binding protein